MRTSERKESISSNQVIRNIRLKGGSPVCGPLSTVRSEDGEKIQSIARRIQKGTLSPEDILITSGFGLGSDLEVPLRLPALAIPGLEVLERFRRLGLPIPKYLLYQATTFIAETNDLDRDKALEASKKMEEYLKRYIKRFHEALINNIIFKFGIELGEEGTGEANALIENIYDKEGSRSDIDLAMSKIRMYGTNKGRDQADAEKYAAVNMVFSGGSRNYYPFSTELTENGVIMPLGGRTEEPFFFLATELNRTDSRSVIPLISPICTRPSYYLFPNLGDPRTIKEFGEISLSETVNRGIQNDILAMTRDGITKDNIGEIYPE